MWYSVKSANMQPGYECSGQFFFFSRKLHVCFLVSLVGLVYWVFLGWGGGKVCKFYLWTVLSTDSISVNATFFLTVWKHQCHCQLNTQLLQLRTLLANSQLLDGQRSSASTTLSWRKTYFVVSMLWDLVGHYWFHHWFWLPFRKAVRDTTKGYFTP